MNKKPMTNKTGDGYVLKRVEINGNNYYSPDMPDKGWWVYPHQKYKIVIDDLEMPYFRLVYEMNGLAQLESNLNHEEHV